jgi:hypothetical protein
MRRPCGVVVSAHVSLSERKPAFAFAAASSTLLFGEVSGYRAPNSLACMSCRSI